MAAIEFRRAMASALAQSRYDDIVNGVKATVITEIRSLDPAAEIHTTDYFNHSFIPDIVVSWNDGEKDRREYYLRFDTAQPVIADEIERLDDRRPAFLGLQDTAGDEEIPPATKEALARHPGVLLTSGAAIGELQAAAASPTLASLIAPAVIRGGKGLLTSEGAGSLAAAATTGFDGVRELDAEATRAAVSAFRRSLQDHFAVEMERSYALLWVGSGGDPDEFPGAVDAKSSLGAGRLRSILGYLFRSPAIGDADFWQRIGSFVSEDDLLSFSEVTSNPNLHSLVEAKLNDLRMVSVSASSLIPKPPTPQWSISDGSLRLHVDEAMLDFVRDGRRHNRLPAAYDAVSLEAVANRAVGLTIDSIEVDSDTLAVTFGAKGDGSVIDDEWFANISRAEGFNAVNTVLVRMPSGGKLRCDLRRGVATMEGTKMRPLAELGEVAARLLPPLSPHARTELAKVFEQIPAATEDERDPDSADATTGDVGPGASGTEAEPRTGDVDVIRIDDGPTDAS